MLKDTLDLKVRKYRANRPLIKSPSSSEIKAQAEKDANCIWSALEKVFLRNCKDDNRLTITLGICYDSPTSEHNIGKVYYAIGSSRIRKLLFRKMKFPEETMEIVRSIAKKNGIHTREAPFRVKNTNFLSCIYAEWYLFTYTPFLE